MYTRNVRHSLTPKETRIQIFLFQSVLIPVIYQASTPPDNQIQHFMRTHRRCLWRKLIAGEVCFMVDLMRAEQHQ